MTKYDKMAKLAEELWDKAQATENLVERAYLEMQAANLWYDIEEGL